MSTVHYHRNPSHSPILSALTVGTDCVDVVMHNAVGTIGIVMPWFKKTTHNFTATLSCCECHTNIEDLGQNYNFYVAFTV